MDYKNIFEFLLGVNSIADCIKYFNENISPEEKKQVINKINYGT